MYGSSDPHGQLSVAAPPKPDVDGLDFFLLLDDFLANMHVLEEASRPNTRRAPCCDAKPAEKPKCKARRSTIACILPNVELLCLMTEVGYSATKESQWNDNVQPCRFVLGCLLSATNSTCFEEDDMMAGDWRWEGGDEECGATCTSFFVLVLFALRIPFRTSSGTCGNLVSFSSPDCWRSALGHTNVWLA